MATVKYKDMELEDMQTAHVANLPKKMLLWDDDGEPPKERVVTTIAIDNEGSAFAIARPEKGTGVIIWPHFAEIPEKPAPRRATNRELARWLAQGNGECILERTAGMADHKWIYEDGCEDEPANGYDSSDNELKVRKWSDTEWHEPDVEYMGIEVNDEK